MTYFHGVTVEYAVRLAGPHVWMKNVHSLGEVPQPAHVIHPHQPVASSKDTLLPVSLSCHLASMHQRALILFIQTLALYKSFTYLLTHGPSSSVAYRSWSASRERTPVLGTPVPQERRSQPSGNTIRRSRRGRRRTDGSSWHSAGECFASAGRPATAGYFRTNRRRSPGVLSLSLSCRLRIRRRRRAITLRRLESSGGPRNSSNGLVWGRLRPSCLESSEGFEVPDFEVWVLIVNTIWIRSWQFFERSSSFEDFCGNVVWKALEDLTHPNFKVWSWSPQSFTNIFVVSLSYVLDLRTFSATWSGKLLSICSVQVMSLRSYLRWHYRRLEKKLLSTFKVLKGEVVVAESALQIGRMSTFEWSPRCL